MTEQRRALWKLVPQNKEQETLIIRKGQVLLGRVETCDLIIQEPHVSSIHATLTLADDGNLLLTDLKSTNGTFVNGERISSKVLKKFDNISFGQCIYSLQEIDDDKDSLFLIPNIEDQTSPTLYGNFDTGLIKDLQQKKLKDDYEATNPLLQLSDNIISRHAAHEGLEVDQQRRKQVIALSDLGPKYEYSEYIFEDKDFLYPIFKEAPTKDSLEFVSILSDTLLSLDYIPLEHEKIFVTGKKSFANNVNLDSLNYHDQKVLAEVSGEQLTVHTLDGYDSYLVRKKEMGHKSIRKSVTLEQDDVLFLEKGDLKLFVRRVPSPPAITPPPFFGRDRRLLILLIPIFFVIFGLMTALHFIKVDPAKIEEKAPEHIVKILYKPPVKEPLPVETEKAPVAEKEGANTDQSAPVAKAKIQAPAPSVPTIEKRKEVTVKEVPKILTRKPAQPTPPAPTSKPINKVGDVEVKSAKTDFNFSQKYAKFLNSSGQSKAVVYQKASAHTDEQALTAGAPGSNKIGKLSTEGVAEGRINVGTGSGIGGEGYSAKGLSDKKTIELADVAHKTVLLGIIDPKEVRKALAENIPLLSNCYDEEIDRQKHKNPGSVILDFNIGASGRANNINVLLKNGVMSDKGIACIAQVLKAIQFPEPKGGGVVRIRQPMNFK